MTASLSAAARISWAAASVSLVLLSLAACGGQPADADERQRPAVSYSSVEALRTEAAISFIGTDDALAEMEAAVAALDSAGQARARPRLDALRDTRARLQARLDSLDAAAFATPEAFAEASGEIREAIAAYDVAIARDRTLIEPDAAGLRARVTARLDSLRSRADRLRADSTREAIVEAARLDSARVGLERTLSLVGQAPFDSLRDVLAAGVGDLRRLETDTLAMRLRPDSLR
jgi:hypothetical protein